MPAYYGRGKRFVYCKHREESIEAGSCEDCATERAPKIGLLVRNRFEPGHSEAYGRHFDTQRELREYAARQGDTIHWDR